MSTSPRRPVLLVGVVPGQSEVVPRVAVALADDLSAELVFAFVDPGLYLEREPGGGSHLASIDPDLTGDENAARVQAMDDHLRTLLAGQQVAWRVEHLGGDPGRELARLADRVDARLVVVGTRQPGWRGRMAEYFAGSVAVQLAHHQSRPVVVVPAAAVGFDQPALWE